MKNHLILHGHFYQPPREDPWTGIVPQQPGAKPFHDWNSRITRECYAANSASRFLRYDGRIEDIVNNYEFLSFNFGPTLLGWLESNAPNVYGRIIEADHSSRLRLGHGNAIAQSYNHTILPLDDPEDALIQIRWGLEDFRHRFGRNPEGMWLPECGINRDIARLLAREGVEFVILAPWQGDAVRPLGAPQWEELGDSHVPSHRSYRITDDEGDCGLNAFFYESGIAGGISFSHYLRSAEALYARLLLLHQSKDPSYLIHAATDGEIYGHHEPYGDMCLAALTKLVSSEERLEFSNYASYLEQYPPLQEVRLRSGEEGKGTSWSCSHGVSRWFKNCGCSTGGKEHWNQDWRNPLRGALRSLSGAIKEIRDNELSTLSRSAPMEIITDYGFALSGSMSREQFAGRYLAGANRDLITKFLILLEGEKFRHYMFTSCGWFFADITGIEARHNLLYALKAIELYQPFTGRNLIGLIEEKLADAVSNLPDRRTGKDILQDIKEDILPDGREAALYFHIRRLLHPERKDSREYGIYRLEEYRTEEEDGEVSAIAVMTDISTESRHICRVTSILDPGKEMKLAVAKEDGTEETEISADQVERLPGELRHALSELLIASAELTCGSSGEKVIGVTARALDWAKELGIEISQTVKKSAEVAVNWKIQHLLPLPASSLSSGQRKSLREVLDFASAHALDFDRRDAGLRFTAYLSMRFGKGDCMFSLEEAADLSELYALALRSKIAMDITIPQNMVFDHLRQWRELLETAERKRPAKRDRAAIEPLLLLAQAFGIYADDIRKRFTPFRKE
jgi:hypothetical protein